MKMNYRLLFPLFLLVSCPSLRVVAMDETQELVFAADGYVNRDFDENILREMGFKEIQIKAMNPYYYGAMASLEQQPVEATTWGKDPEFEASKAHPRAKWNQIPVADVVTKLEESLKLGSITESTADAAKAELHELNSAQAVFDAQLASKDLHTLAFLTASQKAKQLQADRLNALQLQAGKDKDKGLEYHLQTSSEKKRQDKFAALDNVNAQRVKTWFTENDKFMRSHSTIIDSFATILPKDDLAKAIEADNQKIKSLSAKLEAAKPAPVQPAAKSALASILSVFWRS